MPGGKICHQADQCLEHHQAVAHFDARQRPHISAAVARQGQDAFGGQTFEGLAHGPAAHAVVTGEIGLDQPLSGDVDARPNASDDRIDDAIGRSHFRRPAAGDGALCGRLAPLCGRCDAVHCHLSGHSALSFPRRPPTHPRAHFRIRSAYAASGRRSRRPSAKMQASRRPNRSAAPSP